MQSIVFNFTGSSLSQKSEAIALKAGFILCDDACTAGTTCFDIFFRKNMQRLSAKNQFNHMVKAYSHEPEFVKELVKMDAQLKSSHSLKHKKQDLLVARKKAEQTIRKCWLGLLDSYETVHKAMGFGQLKELTESGEIGCYFMNISPEDPSHEAITASNLMQRLLFATEEDDDSEPELFFLTGEFLSDDYKVPNRYSPDDSEACDPQNIYLHPCIVLPDIHELSSAELRAIRLQLQDAGSSFRKSMNEWIDMCYFGNEIKAGVDFFKTQVVTAANVLQEEIDSNSMLKTCCAGKSNSRHTIYIGEIPVWQLWDFYYHFEALTEETWMKLQQLKEQGAYQNERWPVMVLNATGKEKETAPHHFETEIQHTKKYIAID